MDRGAGPVAPYLALECRGPAERIGVRRAKAAGTMILAVLSVGIAGCLGDETLSATEINEILTGNTVRGTSTDGQEYHVFFGADGTLRMITATGFRDVGRWRVRDDSYCGRWMQVRQGRESCFTIRREEPGMLLFLEGERQIPMRLMSGDAQGMTAQ